MKTHLQRAAEIFNGNPSFATFSNKVHGFCPPQDVCFFASWQNASNLIPFIKKYFKSFKNASLVLF